MACDRVVAALADVPAPVLLAQVAVVRSGADVDRLPDEVALRHASEVLVGEGEWEDAAAALAVLATAAARRGDAVAARRDFTVAIGCAEAAGARRLGPRLLRRLAQVEIEAREPARAVRLLHHALMRLEKVLLLGARLAEAETVDVLGDAHAALGDLDRAVMCWRDAAERQDRLDRTSVAARIREKFSRRA